MVIEISNKTMDKAVTLKKKGFTIKEIMRILDISESFCSYGTFRSKVYRYTHNVKENSTKCKLIIEDTNSIIPFKNIDEAIEYLESLRG